MNANGTVKSTQKIASGVASAPLLANGDEFGIGVASLGDLDGDGITELAVGAFRDDTGGIGRGAVHVLFMNANGTVKQSTKIASGTSGAPVLGDGDYFGRSVASLGDLDGDGATDFAVGAYRDATGGASRGALHVLFMNAGGTVKRAETIAHLTGGGPVLANDNRFGSGVAAIGDLDGDGVIELAVGAETDGTGGNARGAVHVLFLQPGNTAPVFTSSATANVPENTTTVMTVTAMDADVPPQSVSFSLVGGIDQSKFSITTSGVLSFISPPNFEAPDDLNGDNIYTVNVLASDGDGGTATQVITVNVTPINDNPPIITSTDTLNVPENTTAVLTVAATDADLPPQAVTFSMIGGADQAKFNITSGGVLSFNTPPDFEASADANGDNVYVVIVQASDGSLPDVQAILVTVTNISEPLLTGDYNRNGSVDAADYIVWRNSLGQTGTGLAADGNGNGQVDAGDYNLWRANFGRTSTASGASALEAAAQTDEFNPVAALQMFVVPASAGSGRLKAELRAGEGRPVAIRSARRDFLWVSNLHDDALHAWLASRAWRTQPTSDTESYIAPPRDRDDQDSAEPVEALDLAFAIL
jgi:hypothetical protein